MVFHINSGPSIPALFEGFIARNVPKVPAAALRPAGARIGFVMPTQRDLWCEVDESTDITLRSEGDVSVSLSGTRSTHRTQFFH